MLIMIINHNDQEEVINKIKQANLAERKPVGQFWRLASHYFFFTFIIRQLQYCDAHHNDQEVVIKIIKQVNLAERKGEFILTEEGLQCNSCVR